MHKTILRQVVGQRVIPRQLAQEIPHMRLVSSDQLAESGSILTGYCPCDKVTILARSQRAISGLVLIRDFVQDQVSDTDGQRKRGNTHKNSRYFFFVRNTKTK